ncbi:MAG: OsmC family protein [Phycisphaerales bacterium]|nr:OsmC family protein [Phycisphaerales bacterium]
MTTAASVVNGVDVGVIQGLVGAARADPAAAAAGFHVVTRWTGGAATETSVSRWSLGGRTMGRAFAFRTDEPPELCGRSEAANPQEVLMGAMNACIMVGFVANCALEGVELESLEIETEGELDLRGFLGLDASVKPGYDELRYTVRVKADAPLELLQTIHWRVMKTSPNFFNISQPVRLVPRLIVE